MYALNLEHVGDLIEKGILNQLNKKAARGVRFSEYGHQELSAFLHLKINNLRIAQTIFATGDTALARQLMGAESRCPENGETVIHPAFDAPERQAGGKS